jgi:hypothetical protein
MQRQPGAGGFTTIDLNVTKYSANPTGRVQNHVVNYVRERAEAKARKAARAASSVARSEARKEKERVNALAASAPEIPALTAAEERLRARQAKGKATREAQAFMNESVDRMERMPCHTSWGYDNGYLGFNTSSMGVVNTKLLSRIQSGEVARQRPIDMAIGRNIKFGARHSATVGVSVPNYGDMDPVRQERQDKARGALGVVAHMSISSGPPDDWQERTAELSRLSTGGYVPYCGSPPLGYADKPIG